MVSVTKIEIISEIAAQRDNNRQDCRNLPCMGGWGLALAAKPPKILVFEAKIEIIDKIAAICLAWGAAAWHLRQNPRKF